MQEKNSSGFIHPMLHARSAVQRFSAQLANCEVNAPESWAASPRSKSRPPHANDDFQIQLCIWKTPFFGSQHITSFQHITLLQNLFLTKIKTTIFGIFNLFPNKSNKYSLKLLNLTKVLSSIFWFVFQHFFVIPKKCPSN